MYLYICVRFELKFSTGKVDPKPDSPVQVRTQALPLRARISLISWYVAIKTANAGQFVVRRAA